MSIVKKVTVNASMGKGFTTESKIREHTLFVDQPAQSGGQNKGPTPLEYLFLALGGCICSIARIVAHQKKINLRGIEVSVSGELDLGGLQGKSSDNRIGFNDITVETKIDADMTDEEKKIFLKEVDKRCPVSENLNNTTPVQVKLVS